MGTPGSSLGRSEGMPGVDKPQPGVAPINAQLPMGMPSIQKPVPQETATPINAQMPMVTPGVAAEQPWKSGGMRAQIVGQKTDPDTFRPIGANPPPVAPVQPPPAAVPIPAQLPPVTPIQPPTSIQPPVQQAEPINAQLPTVTPIPAVTPPTPEGVGMSEFGPGNDLRSTQFNPLESNRLAETGGQVDTARNALATAPDRQALALETLRLAQEQGQPAYDQQVRQVGQNAAKWGRIGAGMTTSELGDLSQNRARDLDQLRRSTSLEAAGSMLADRTSNLQSLGALEADQANREAGQRGELRGERDYQTEAANKALEDSIRQRQLEEDLTQGAYGRNMGRAQLGLQGAAISQGQADQSQTGTNDFLQQLALEESLRNRAKPKAG
jgi:hypothetical protein